MTSTTNENSEVRQNVDESSNLPEMTFWNHLEALRWMLVRSFIAIAILVIGGFAFIPWLFQHIIMAPCRNDFFLYKFLAKLGSFVPFTPDEFVEPFNVNIINIKLPSQFFLQVSLSFWFALLVAFPYIVFEIWRFVCPALYKNERRRTERAFIFGTVMFFMGCFVGYALVFPLTLRFLYTYQISPEITNQLSLDSYMSNFLMLVFMMGIIFELPLVSALLSKIGLLNRSFFKQYRKHAIVVLLIVAAVITPSSDPFTLMAVFLPIYILWEFSAILVKPAPKNED